MSVQARRTSGPADTSSPRSRTWPAIVNGTDDWLPILGEAPGVPGFFHAIFPWMGFTGGPITAHSLPKPAVKAAWKRLNS